MRPSQKTKEERLWVLDTINKYFDVIVEEEDEEEKEDIEDDDDSIGVTFFDLLKHSGNLSLMVNSFCMGFNDNILNYTFEVII
jgi:hypothetical protein